MANFDDVDLSDDYVDDLLVEKFFDNDKRAQYTITSNIKSFKQDYNREIKEFLLLMWTDDGNNNFYAGLTLNGFFKMIIDCLGGPVSRSLVS